MRQNLEIWQGADFTFAHVHKVGGSPVNLTGYSGRMAIKRSHAALYAAFLSSGPDAVDGSLTLASNGTVTVAMTAAQTEVLAEDLGLFLLARYPDPHKLPVETFIYDLEITSPGGVVTRLLEGRLRLHRSVTTE